MKFIEGAGKTSGGSNIFADLHQCLEQLGGKPNPRLVILVSDGQGSSGPDPRLGIKGQNIGLFAVGVGSGIQRRISQRCRHCSSLLSAYHIRESSSRPSRRRCRMSCGGSVTDTVPDSQYVPIEPTGNTYGHPGTRIPGHNQHEQMLRVPQEEGHS